MAEPILQGPRVLPRIRQGIATGVPEHVAVNREGEAGALTDAFYKPIDRVRGEWSAALGRKYEAAVGELPPQFRSPAAS